MVNRNTFRMRSRDFGLTYADARDTTKEDIYTQLQLLVINDVGVDRCMVAEEVGHISGLRHYHCYIRFTEKVTCNEFSFDMFGLHPHIDRVRRRGTRSIEPMLLYLTKEDTNPLSTFDWRRMLSEENGGTKGTNEPDWDAYANESLTQNQVITRLAEDGFSARFANHFNNWIAYIRRRYPETRPEIYRSQYSHFNWKLPESLRMWKISCFEGYFTLMLTENEWYRPRSLVLIGPSRSGKTEWARSLGHHMYFNNLINLDDWDETADYIILDDFSSDINKFFPCWKCFFGGQKQFTLTDKYRGKRTVHWGKPMIWLSNEDIFGKLNIEHINFIKANCEVVVLSNKLY